jgi:DNA adenine methylase
MTQYRTPLRYPGGKQRLAPFIREVLDANPSVGADYVEPYAGGAGVAMELLLSRDVSRVHLNDSSIHIYAFWQAVVTEPEAFCRKVASVTLSLDEWRRQREILRHPEGHSLLDVGFSTFYLNRCNRSGVLTAGVIGGFAQEGRWRIDARFPRIELIRRIEAIATRAKDISVTNFDAEHFLQNHVPRLPESSLLYCDPPYFHRAERLYLNTYTRDDHVRLANVIQAQISWPWLVSYDAHDDVIQLYDQRRKFTYSLQYSAIHAYKGREVFVFSDDLTVPAKSSLPYIDRGLAAAAFRS